MSQGCVVTPWAGQHQATTLKLDNSNYLNVSPFEWEVLLETDPMSSLEQAEGLEATRRCYKADRKAGKGESSLQKSSACTLLGKSERSGNTERIRQVENLHGAASGNTAHVFSCCKLKQLRWHLERLCPAVPAEDLNIQIRIFKRESSFMLVIFNIYISVSVPCNFVLVFFVVVLNQCKWCGTVIT